MKSRKLACLVLALGLMGSFVACSDKEDVKGGNDSGVNSEEMSSEESSGESGEEEVILVGTEGIEYGISRDGAYARAIAYRGTETEIVIASVYEGLPVKEIGWDDSAYVRPFGQITKVVIPDSVVRIAAGAFSYTQNLTSVVFGENSKLKHIGNAAFMWCTELKEINIPDGVTDIGISAFAFTSITEISIPDSITYIGGGAFEFCDIECTVKEGLNYVGNLSNPYLFLVGVESTDITSVNIESTCRVIDASAFEDCENLEYNVKDGLKYVGNNTNPYLYLAGVESTDITSATIESECKAVSSFVFEDCSNLTSLVIPDNITSLAGTTFISCNATEVTCPTIAIPYIPKSVQKLIITTDGNIKESAFARCEALTEIEVGKDNKTYKSVDGNLYSKDGKKLIRYATGKMGTSFTVPDGVTSIDYRAFCYCSNLQEIIIGDEVTSIDNMAFYSNSGLTKVTIGSEVKSIGEDAFGMCNNLTSITFDGTTEQWEKIKKGEKWNYNVPATVVICTDGEVTV